MNREIKFRAWDAGKMYAKAAVGLPFNPSVFDDEKGFLECTETVQIMQFTGLKDKNWKEIYEGDIIRCSAYQREMEEFTDKVLQVSYADGYFYPFGFNARWRSGVYDIEVLWNVFENPELLK